MRMRKFTSVVFSVVLTGAILLLSAILSNIFLSYDSVQVSACKKYMLTTLKLQYYY